MHDTVYDSSAMRLENLLSTFYTWKIKKKDCDHSASSMMLKDPREGFFYLTLTIDFKVHCCCRLPY